MSSSYLSGRHDGLPPGAPRSAPMTSGWHSAASSPPSLSSNRSISQDLLVMEKKRKAKEEAVKDLNSALLDETLAGLRAKAQQLQNDKWMYNDVQL